MWTSKLLILAVIPILASGQQFKCPAKDGQYPDQFQCDKYYVCKDGKATEKLCEDGLVFDPAKRFNKCDHMHNVDCEERTELQDPQPTAECERRNGFFAHQNPATCHLFLTCIDGKASINDCPAKLVFDELTATCVWPENSARSGCLREETLNDGFQCPTDRATGPDQAAAELHPRYPHPSDCQKFYICLNGVTPREHGCELGEVYNTALQQCDLPENVADCADWYKDDPLVGGPKEVGDRVVIKNRKQRNV